jgi:hypothetical protein
MAKPSKNTAVARQRRDRPPVTVDIRPGPTTYAVKKQWHKFWLRLAAECQRQLKAETESKREG